jgi:hypothetical protein
MVHATYMCSPEWRPGTTGTPTGCVPGWGRAPADAHTHASVLNRLGAERFWRPLYCWQLSSSSLAEQRPRQEGIVATSESPPAGWTGRSRSSRRRRWRRCWSGAAGRPGPPGRSARPAPQNTEVSIRGIVHTWRSKQEEEATASLNHMAVGDSLHSGVAVSRGSTAAEARVMTKCWQSSASPNLLLRACICCASPLRARTTKMHTASAPRMPSSDMIRPYVLTAFSAAPTLSSLFMVTFCVDAGTWSVHSSYNVHAYKA